MRQWIWVYDRVKESADIIRFHFIDSTRIIYKISVYVYFAFQSVIISTVSLVSDCDLYFPTRKIFQIKSSIKAIPDVKIKKNGKGIL